MLPSLTSLGLSPSLEVLEQIDLERRYLTLCVRLTATSAPCPRCGIMSSRVHSYAWRCLADTPCFGHPLILRLHRRRFRCVNPNCPRQTFSEPLSCLAPERARQTERVRALHRGLGLAMGGNPGARTAAAVGAPVSGTTVRRRVRQGVLPPPSPGPRVLGVDDWAWRKGHTYGTILVDLERRRVVDLLPDRQADSLAAWLQQHPTVAIVVRDRAGAYADGAGRGAPEAKQVADRWHLLRNGSDALQRHLDHHHGDLREAARVAGALPKETSASAAPEPATTVMIEERRPPTKAQAHSLAARQRREARYAEAVRLREQGHSLRATARALGIERKTLRRWLRVGHASTWQRMAVSPRLLDPYQAFLETRWQEGCRNAAALWRELREQGYSGQKTGVRQWAARRRQSEPAGETTAPASVCPPTSRQAARLLLAEPDTLPDKERGFLAALRDSAPAVAQAGELMRRFHAMVKERAADRLKGWIAEAASGAFPGFAASLDQDFDAVRAALTEPWSTGPVEGHVNRLKVIKRTMYGRAGFALLRARVLSTA